MARSSIRARVVLLVAAIALVAVVVAIVVAVRRESVPDRGAPASTPTVRRECAATDYSDPSQGVLSWAGDFDGEAVDPTRWTVRDATSLSFDEATIRARNATVADGLLRLEARREEGGGRSYSTAYLDTIGKASQRYGRWEMTARLPVAPDRSAGLWPAFWLRADDRAGEIDVMEAWGTPVRAGRRLGGSAAWTIHEDTRSAPGTRSVTGWAQGTGRLDTDFHTFAVDRSPTCLRFSVDGRTTGTVSVVRHPWIRDALASTLNIRLNLQVGSRYWGSPRATTQLPAAVEVDRIRVFGPRDR